jgi:hypothetical protein
MTREILPPCDIEALLTIEAVAPHLLTPHDRHCIRAYRAAPAVRRGVPVMVLLIAAALAALPIIFGWGR